MSPTPGPTMDTRGGYEPQQHASGEYDYQQNYYSSGYDEEYQENQNAHRQHHYAPSVSEAPSHHPTNVGSASQYQMQQHQQHYADAADFVYDEELQQQQAKMLQQYHHQMTQQFMTPMIKAPFANNPTFGLIPLPATKVLLERLKGWQTLLSNLVNHLQIVADQEKAAAENLGKSVVNLSSLIVPIRSNPAVSKALMEEPSDHFGLDVFAGHGSVKSFFNTFYETQARRTAAHYAASQFLETQTLAALRMIAEEVEHKIEDAAEEWAVLDQELAQDGEKFVVLTQALGVLVRWQREMAVKYIQAENFLTANGLPLIPPTPSMDGSTGAMTPRAMSPMSGATPQAPLFEQQQQQQQQAGWASYLGFSKKDVKPVAGSATPQSQNGSEKSSVSTPPNGTVAPVGGVAVVEEKQILIPPFPVVAPGAANGVGPGDPWLYNTTIKHHIARCVAKQKSIRARLLDQQQNIAVFEQTVISLVQNAVSGYVEFRARQITAEVNNINQPLFRATEAMEGPIEWGQFKTDHFDILIDEDAPFVEARHMIYDGMDHPLSEIVREGPLLRLEKGGIMFKKPGWREAYFVLTAAGYLHGFPNAPVVSVDVVAGEFVQPVEKAQDENDGTVAKDQAGAPVSIAAWMVGGKKKPARKRRDTVYYDSATAKFKAQEDEEEKAKSKKDQMDDLQPEMVKNQAEALFKQLSDGALDRGEPDLCLYLPECVIAPLGMPVDGKTASGWTAMEFEIQHKGRSSAGAFTRTGEKYRLKALSQDQAEFWWDLISTMTKSNGDEGIIAFKNLATTQAQDVTLMTPGSSHPAYPTGMLKLSTIRPPSFHFRNTAAPNIDLPMSPSRSMTGGESTTLWTSSDMTSLPRANNMPNGRPTSYNSQNGRLQTLRESHGDAYADVTIDNHPVPNADDDTDRSDDEDVLRARRRSLTAMASPYGTAPWKNNWNTPAGVLTSGSGSTSFNAQRRASSASIESSATTVSEQSVSLNARTSPMRTPGREIDVPRSEGSPVYAQGGESSTSTSRTMAYSEDLLANGTPVPISPMLHKIAPTPPPTPLANHGHIGSPIAYHAHVSTGPTGGVDLMQAVLKAKAQRAHTGSPVLNEESAPPSPARGIHSSPTPLGATPTNADWTSAAEVLLHESEELLGKHQSGSPVASSPQRSAPAAPLPQAQFAWTPSAQSAFASIGADLQSDSEDSDRGASRARGPQAASSKLVGLPAAYQRHHDDDSDDDRMDAPRNVAATDEYQSTAPTTPRLFTIADSARRGSGPEVRTMYSPVVETRSPFAAYRNSTPTEDDKTEIASSVGGRRISSGVSDTAAAAAIVAAASSTNLQQDRWGATADDDNGDLEQMLEDLTRSLSPTSAAATSVGFRASYNDVRRRSALQLVKEEDEDEDEDNMLSPRGDADGMLSPVSPSQPDLLLSGGEGEEKKERKHREHRSKDKDRERRKKDKDGEKPSRREKSSKRGDEDDEERARRRKERKEREKLEKAAAGGGAEEDEEEKARRRKERKERKEREEREGGGGEDKEKKDRKKDKERKKEKDGSADPDEEVRRRERRERKKAEKAER